MDRRSPEQSSSRRSQSPLAESQDARAPNRAVTPAGPMRSVAAQSQDLRQVHERKVPASGRSPTPRQDQRRSEGPGHTGRRSTTPPQGKQRPVGAPVKNCPSPQQENRPLVQPEASKLLKDQSRTGLMERALLTKPFGERRTLQEVQPQALTKTTVGERKPLQELQPQVCAGGDGVPKLHEEEGLRQYAVPPKPLWPPRTLQRTAECRRLDTPRVYIETIATQVAEDTDTPVEASPDLATPPRANRACLQLVSSAKQDPYTPASGRAPSGLPSPLMPTPRITRSTGTQSTWSLAPGSASSPGTPGGPLAASRDSVRSVPAEAVPPAEPPAQTMSPAMRSRSVLSLRMHSFPTSAPASVVVPSVAGHPAKATSIATSATRTPQAVIATAEPCNLPLSSTTDRFPTFAEQGPADAASIPARQSSTQALVVTTSSAPAPMAESLAVEVLTVEALGQAGPSTFDAASANATPRAIPSMGLHARQGTEAARLAASVSAVADDVMAGEQRVDAPPDVLGQTTAPMQGLEIPRVATSRMQRFDGAAARSSMLGRAVSQVIAKSTGLTTPPAGGGGDQVRGPLWSPHAPSTPFFGSGARSNSPLGETIGVASSLVESFAKALRQVRHNNCLIDITTQELAPPDPGARPGEMASIGEGVG